MSAFMLWAVFVQFILVLRFHTAPPPIHITGHPVLPTHSGWKLWFFSPQNEWSRNRPVSSFALHSTFRVSTRRSRHATSWLRPSGARRSGSPHNWAVCEPARANSTHRDSPDVGGPQRMRTARTGNGDVEQRRLASTYLLPWRIDCVTMTSVAVTGISKASIISSLVRQHTSDSKQ